MHDLCRVPEQNATGHSGEGIRREQSLDRVKIRKQLLPRQIENYHLWSKITPGGKKCLAGLEGMWSGLCISFPEQWQRRRDACWVILVG